MDFNTVVQKYEICNNSLAIKRCIVALGGRHLVHEEYSSEDEFKSKIVEFFNTSTSLKLKQDDSLDDILVSIWLFEEKREIDILKKISEQPEITTADFENYPLTIPRR